MGQTYMLKAHEELFDYELDEGVERLLKDSIEKGSDGKRIKHRMISYKLPYNNAMQVFDYHEGKKEARVVFGPGLVILNPEETFTVNTLSGKTPKEPGVIKTLNIRLGPEFSTDEVVVETSDHAALKLKLAYSWYFNVDKTDKKSSCQIFRVKDFIGDLCSTMACKIRAAVAGSDFDHFHRKSADIIQESIFGIDETTKSYKKHYEMPNNNLVITHVDIQNVEPMDPKIRESLQQSVTLAIEITTQRQEALAKQSAEKQAQMARGELELLKLTHCLNAEKLKTKLLELQADTKAVEVKGKLVAETKAKTEAAIIRGEGNLITAQLKTDAKKILEETKISDNENRNDILTDYETKMTELKILKSRSLAKVEANKLKEMVNSIGKEAIISMACAGPEYQAELLNSLGLKGFILTDGNNPINLFNTANSLVKTVENEDLG